MSKTRAELINQVLDRLQILVYGQAPSDDDIAKVDRLVDTGVAQLSALDIYDVKDAGSLGPTDGSIEDQEFLPLADYIAQFHLLADERTQALAIIAESNLRLLAAPSRTLRVLRIDPAVVPARGYYRGTF